MMADQLVSIRNLLASAVGSAAKAYYAGDIGIPSKMALPAVVVRPRFTQMERPHTAGDQYRYGISIMVYIDVAGGMTAAGNTDGIMKAQQNLIKLLEEADTDGAPKITTVLGCLMRQSNLRSSTFNYNINPRITYNPSSGPNDAMLLSAELTLDYLTNIVPRKA